MVSIHQTDHANYMFNIRTICKQWGNQPCFILMRLAQLEFYTINYKQNHYSFLLVFVIISKTHSVLHLFELTKYTICCNQQPLPTHTQPPHSTRVAREFTEQQLLESEQAALSRANQIDKQNQTAAMAKAKKTTVNTSTYNDLMKNRKHLLFTYLTARRKATGGRRCRAQANAVGAGQFSTRCR